MFALDAFLDTVPDALVGPAARTRLRAFGDQLPDALTGQFGLEIRLGDDPRVDLAVLVATPRQLSVLAGHDARIRLSRRLTTLPAWRATARLAARSLDLVRSGSTVPAGVWLEFDADADANADANADAGRARPLPGVFVAVAAGTETGDEPTGWASRAPGAPRADTESVPRAVGEVLAAVWPDRAGPDRSALTDRVRELAGHGLPIRQIGLFPHRSATAVRLVTAASPALGHLVEMLDRCGWSGPQADLETWVRACASWCDEIHLALDLTVDGLAPRIGVETFFTGLPQPRQEPRWGGLLAELERAALCAPAKRRALAELDTAYTVPMLTRRRYRQGLHHLKVVLGTGAPAVAKAYFGTREDPV